MKFVSRLLLCLFAVAITTAAADQSLWDLPRLSKAPAAEWGAKDGLVQAVTYTGEPWRGKPTKVFAYVGRPEGPGPFPAMVLVHGGGGKAFKDWANHWAARGYAAIAMDTAGRGPDGSEWENGGPGQGHDEKFHAFTDESVREMWTYHAVADVILGHSLLRSLPEVNPDRIGLTGISWGGYLTCITAGVDNRFKLAIPVYGCGFLGDNSVWRDKEIAGYDAKTRQLWLQRLDPSRYVGNCQVPMLFLDGTNDFAYPLDSHRKTVEMVDPKLTTVAIHLNLRHGHIWTFPEVDTFVDSILGDGKPLCQVGEVRVANDIASAPLAHLEAGSAAELFYTTDTGVWQKRPWQTAPAEITGDRVTAAIPPVRPITFFLQITDARGLKTSSVHFDLSSKPGETNHALIPMPKLENDFYDWYARHRQTLLARLDVAPDVVFIGDSITHLWGGEPKEPRGNRGSDAWPGDRALNLGFGWDRTQNLLWRLDHGEIDRITPKLAVINIGTNNLAGTGNAKANTPEEIAEAITQVCEQVKIRLPETPIVLMGVFPRGRAANDGNRAKVAAINAIIKNLDSDPRITFLDIGDKFIAADGSIPKELMPDALHPSAAGYAIWRDALAPYLPNTAVGQ